MVVENFSNLLHVEKKVLKILKVHTNNGLQKRSVQSILNEIYKSNFIVMSYYRPKFSLIKEEMIFSILLNSILHILNLKVVNQKSVHITIYDPSVHFK